MAPPASDAVRTDEPPRWEESLMRWLSTACLLLLLGLITLVAACGRTPSAEADYAPGAFPPTLSDKDYHRQSWQRADCLTCHEQGVNDAPKLKHRSLAPLARNAKCRTCHVTARGSAQG